MKSFQSDLRRNPPTHSVPTPAFPVSSRTSEPTKTLLVVDDDQEVREVEAEFLCQQSYNVLQAGSAAEALRVAASAPTIDLLITDLSMPGVDGLELTRRFLAVHPTTPVLVVSGSLPVLRTLSEEDLDRFGFLAKPFQFNELLQKVRLLLDAAPPLAVRKRWCCD